MSFIEFFKKGNTSSGLAALGNAFLVIAKGIAAGISGSGAMLATTLHSAADTTNQAFVYFGSALAEKEPTERFPTGFGRVVNLFVLVAVVIISIMAYESIIKGWNLIQNPKEPTNFWLNVGILILAILIDGYVLIKTMKQISVESRDTSDDGEGGLSFITNAFKNVGLAAPPTRLVFYEDIIATLGAFVALLAIVIAELTDLYILDGVGTLIIGVLLIGIALKIGYQNTIGLIGVSAPKVVEDRITEIILSDPDVVDIKRMRILQEGRKYHVESYVELTEGLSLAKADDIKVRIQNAVLADEDVDDVTIGILETDGEEDW